MPNKDNKKKPKQNKDKKGASPAATPPASQAKQPEVQKGKKK